MEDSPPHVFFFYACACACVLHVICMNVYCVPNPNSGATYRIFYKILKPRATWYLSFQERARLPAAKAIEVLGRACRAVDVLFEILSNNNYLHLFLLVSC